MATSNIQIILFVEGETDKEFFDALISFYKGKSTKQIKDTKVVNIKGIGRYESKVPSKLKNELIPKYPNKKIIVFCSYDTDVFELAQKPPVNWKSLREKILELDVDSFYEIKAKLMIEDWFLKDIDGICTFLKINLQTKVVGKSGNDKMKWLFKKGNKIYQKGSSCHRFVPSLDIEKIRNQSKGELSDLEKILGVVFPTPKKLKS